jgi:hypothetical protein
VVVRVLALRPEGQRQVALRRAALQPEAKRMAVPLTALRSVQPALPCQVRAEAARPVVPDAVRYPARPSVVAAPKVRVLLRVELKERAQRLAEPEAQQPAEPMKVLRPAEPAGWAEAAAVALPEQVARQALAVRPKAVPGVLAVWDAAAAPQPEAASGAAGLLPEERAAGQGVAGAVPQRAAGQGVAEAVPQPAAEQAAVAVRLRGEQAGPVSEVRRRVARGAQGEPLSAAAWAAVPLSTRLRGDRPAPSPPARSAHAKESLRIAQP